MSEDSPSYYDISIRGNNNNQALRDINIYNYQNIKTKMAGLIEQYKKDRKENRKFGEIVENLEHYLTPKKGSEFIGLDEKLKQGNYSDLIESAQFTKEIFTKKLAKYNLYKSAQEIFAYILADIYVRFQNTIFPLICNDEEHSIVMAKIQSEIIFPMEHKLEEDVLNLYSDSILGMLYFLTGNCHIKWSKNAALSSDV